MLKKFSKNRSGATAIEYGLIAALISIITLASLRELGDSLSFLFEKVNQELIEPDGTFSAGTSGTRTENKLINVTEVGNAKDFEPHKLIEGLYSQKDLFDWMDTNNFAFSYDGIIRTSRVQNFLSDMSQIYGEDMSQDLSEYGNFINESEFNQIMDNLNDTRRAL